ncbi:MAG TPA: methyltransferase domain-containing protein [Solirubrobacteraceae bacterium]|jgi:SAM-dependent methyltransferase|nr:methyltransferase domain-containing protein [Solirubrobacteraceae bacterium]
MSGPSDRVEQQRRYFFEPLLALSGGTLRGRRVLDAGCGEGTWTLQALEAGADFVLGLDTDGRAVELARERLAAAAVDPARYEIRREDVTAAPIEGGYEVALSVAFMERSGKPVELFELLARAGSRLVVIDTALSGAPSSFFELAMEPAGAVPSDGVALLPSREAIVELAAEFDYDCVPLAHAMGDRAGVGDYAAQRRVAFICASEAPLDALEWEEPPPVTPWWRALLDPSSRGWQVPA